MKRILINIIKFGLSISILVYLFNKAAADDQFAGLWTGDKNWTWLGLSLVACLMAHVFGFIRWQVMVQALNLPFSLYEACRIGFIGQFFNLIAFGVIGGDALRAFYVARQFPSRKTEAIASVVADRLIGVLSMFMVASVAFMVFDTTAMESTHPKKMAALRVVCLTVMTCTSIGLAGLAAMFFIPRLHKRPWFKRLLAIPVAGPLLHKMISVVSVYRHKPFAIFWSFVLSGLVNLCFAISIYCIAGALFDDYPLFRNHLVIEPIAMVSNAVPLPGGLGGMEFVLDFLYQAFGCDHGVVVAFAFRLAILLVSAVGAVMWFFNRKQVEELVAPQPQSKSLS